MKVTDNRKNGNKTFGELPVGAVVSLNNSIVLKINCQNCHQKDSGCCCYDYGDSDNAFLLFENETDLIKPETRVTVLNAEIVISGESEDK